MNENRQDIRKDFQKVSGGIGMLGGYLPALGPLPIFANMQSDHPHENDPNISWATKLDVVQLCETLVIRLSH